MSAEVTPRQLLGTIQKAIEFSPVIAITGPRTSGKSTLARQIATTLGGTFLDLDDPATAELADVDPSSFVSGLAEPIVIDEFQHAPRLLAAIKAQLNVDRRPGRYLLTGSARHQAVPDLAKFLTGRIELETLWPFTQSELARSDRSLVDELFDGALLSGRATTATTATTRTNLVDIVLRGGYPIATELAPEHRRRWYRSLIELVIGRIADDVRAVRRPDQMSRVLRLAYSRSAQLLNVSEIGRELGLGRDQTGEYLHLLDAVFLLFKLPAWSTNLGARSVKHPKLHAVDTGLAASLLGLGRDRLQPTDPQGSKQFGHLLETFVVNEVLRHASWAEMPVRLFHYRDATGDEVDLVLERDDGRIVGVEVKASGRLGRSDAIGLRRLRDGCGDRFVGGVVFNGGAHLQAIDDRLIVAPVSALWPDESDAESLLRAAEDFRALPVIDDRSDEDIIGYGPDGLPS